MVVVGVAVALMVGVAVAAEVVVERELIKSILIQYYLFINGTP